MINSFLSIIRLSSSYRKNISKINDSFIKRKNLLKKIKGFLTKINKDKESSIIKSINNIYKFLCESQKYVRLKKISILLFKKKQKLHF